MIEGAAAGWLSGWQAGLLAGWLAFLQFVLVCNYKGVLIDVAGWLACLILLHFTYICILVYKGGVAGSAMCSTFMSCML